MNTNSKTQTQAQAAHTSATSLFRSMLTKLGCDSGKNVSGKQYWLALTATVATQLEPDDAAKRKALHATLTGIIDDLPKNPSHARQWAYEAKKENDKTDEKIDSLLGL